MSQNSMPPEALKRAYDSYFKVLAHRRSRRVAKGTSISAYYDYKSDKTPEPLTMDEIALLCYAGAGNTGLISTDLTGTPFAIYNHGRTFPSPCNSQNTHLLFSTDEGTYCYKPQPTNKVWAVESEDDLKKIIADFEKRIQDNPNVELLLGTEVKEAKGSIGEKSGDSLDEM